MSGFSTFCQDCLVKRVGRLVGIGVAALVFGVGVTLDIGTGTCPSQPIKAQGGVGAGGDVMIYVTNIVFDHKPADSAVSTLAESDALDLGYSEFVNLEHEGSGKAFTQPNASPKNIGEYIWPCPSVAGNQVQARVSGPTRNEPALYEDFRLKSVDTRIKVRFQWPDAPGVPRIKKAVITAEFVAPTPPVGVSLPTLERAPLTAGGAAGTHVEFETTGANAGISKGDSSGHGFVDFAPKSGQSLTGNFKIAGGKWKWSAKYVIYEGQAEVEGAVGLGGDPASFDFETTGPHLVYTVLDLPRADTGWSIDAKKQNNPNVLALDFLFDKCEIHGTTTHSEAADKIADYLHRANGHGLNYDHAYGAPGYTHGWRVTGLVLPSGAPSQEVYKFVVSSSKAFGVLDLEAYINKNGFGTKPTGVGDNSPDREINAVNCYDCALAVTVLSGLTGSVAKARFMQPFGYINPLKFCGSLGVTSNHPFFKDNSFVTTATAGVDELETELDAQGKMKRSRFLNHAFCTIDVSGSENVWDCNVGAPGATKGVVLGSYMNGAIDQSLGNPALQANEVRYNLTFAGPPAASWTQPVAGATSNITVKDMLNVSWQARPPVR